LDEACAHTQAVARYPSDLEALIVERRHLVRLAERDVAAAPRPAARPMVEERDAVDDPIERMARGGIAALERFGAELEAAFTGQRAPAPDPAPEPAPAAAGPAAEPSPNGQPAAPASRAPRVVPEARSRLALLESELTRRFIEVGLVVRAHDVARVVAVATGQDVQWTQ